MSADTTVPASATADANGVASVLFQAPGNARQGFVVSSIALIVNPSPPVPVAEVYRDTIAPGFLLARKTAGDRGTFIGTDDTLWPGQRLIVRWTGAAPGAVCTANLRGSRR